MGVNMGQTVPFQLWGGRNPTSRWALGFVSDLGGKGSSSQTKTKILMPSKACELTAASQMPLSTTPLEHVFIFELLSGIIRAGVIIASILEKGIEDMRGTESMF